MDNPVDFKFIIDALLDNTKPLPPRLLYQLSDLHPDEIVQLTQTWPQIKLERRRALLEDMADLSEDDFLLNYESIGRIGLHDPDAITCVQAIRVLWMDDDQHLAAEYINIMQTHADESVRATAASALGSFVYLGEIEEIPEILLHTIEDALLKATGADKSQLVRRRALESLGYSMRPEVKGLIQSASASHDSLWLESALFAMGRSCNTDWEDIILEFLDHEDPEVLSAAVNAAGELMLKNSRVPLLNMLEDEIEDEDLRAEVIWALSQIGGEGVFEALDDLLDASDDEDEIDLIENALENLNFTEEVSRFDLMDVDFGDEDLEDFIGIDNEDEDY